MRNRKWHGCSRFLESTTGGWWCPSGYQNPTFVRWIPILAPFTTAGSGSGRALGRPGVIAGVRIRTTAAVFARPRGLSVPTWPVAETLAESGYLKSPHQAACKDGQLV